MRIKKFESFKYSFPEEVAFDRWIEKRGDWVSGYKENFIPIELDFFNKLKIDNERKWNNFNIEDDNIYCDLYQINSDDMQDIEVYKMKDEWFLIYDSANTCYIADQFDEVKGFFARNTTLQF